MRVYAHHAMGLGASKRRRAFEFKNGCGCRESGHCTVRADFRRLRDPDIVFKTRETLRSLGVNTPLDSRIMAVLKGTRKTQNAPESFEKILLQLPKVRRRLHALMMRRSLVAP